jgi:hypothetical protein
LTVSRASFARLGATPPGAAWKSSPGVDEDGDEQGMRNTIAAASIRDARGASMQPEAAPNKALRRLEALVGSWVITAQLCGDPPTVFRGGQTTFDARRAAARSVN